MTHFHRVTHDFAVAGQLEIADFERAATMGFKLVVQNRPEHEDPKQPSEAQMRAAAEAAGVAYRMLCFTGAPPPAAVAMMADLLESAPGPVLAYCRSGRRSIMAWAMAQALMGARRPDELVALAAGAGYDLEEARGALETLAPKP